MAEQTPIFGKDDRRWLDEGAMIWRYVPLRTLFFYLSGLVFVPSVAKLRKSDPFEGEFYKDIAWFKHAFRKKYGEKADILDEWIFKERCSEEERQYLEMNKTYPAAADHLFGDRYFEFIRQTRFAWCWFQSFRESAAMWTAYGNQGVAIQSSVTKVRALFKGTDYDLVYGRMIYVHATNGLNTEFNPERDTDLLLRPFFLKRAEYESEKEVRFVTAAGEDPWRGGIILKNLKPEDWITAIRLWPGLTNDEARAIHKAIETLYPGVDCKKSDLLTRPGDHSHVIDLLSEQIEASAVTSWPASVPGALREP